MLYLEDYLEMIEHLPQELRDRFTEIREMDLQVQNSMDSVEERTRQLFANARKMKPDQRDAEFEKIRQDYYKSLEDADEKVHMANQVYDLVDRYLRRLDQELQKFKMELEADNAGITEILEKRSLELDNPPPSINHNHQPKAEKRKYVSSVSSYNITNGSEKRLAASTPTPTTVAAAAVTEKTLNAVTTEALQDTLKTPNTTNAHQSATSSPFSSNHGSPLPAAPQPSLTYSLGHMGAGSNAIAAAASQAIAATQQMQQGRRSASLKASFQAVNSGLPQINKEFILGREVAGASPATASAAAAAVAATVGTGGGTVMPAVPLPPPPVPPIPNPIAVPEPKPGRQKKQSKLQHMLIQSEPSPSPEDYCDTTAPPEETGQPVDWTYDPNEPRYCICNQVSYGDMVACDNGDCPVEWFHYNCVGITQPPRGKWFCPQCTAAMRRRGRKSEK